MNRIANDTQKAKEACSILNDFIGDFIAAERSVGILHTPGAQAHLSKQLIAVLHRLFLMHIILGLSRFAEFYDHYSKIIPASVKHQCKSAYKEIQHRKVRSFRNSYIGHIWDKEKRRPLNYVEVDAALSAIFRSSPGDFLNWINDPTSNNIGQNIAGMVERTRDAIKEHYGLSTSDLSG